MPNIGDRRAPFPLRFGGGAHRQVQTMLDTVRASRPDLLQSRGDASEVDLENKAMARLLASGLRDNARLRVQADPGKASDLSRPVTLPDGTTRTMNSIERWERILGLIPYAGASPAERRATIRGAAVSVASTRRSSVEQAMRNVFGVWFHSLGENSVDNVDYPGRVPAGNITAYWPDSSIAFTHNAEFPGDQDSAWPWTSKVCHIVVRIQPPAATPQSEVDQRVGKAVQILDDMLPAWMSATVSQLAPGQAESGFYAGVSLVGLTAI